mgnify:CR=1 FL=1
MSGYGLIQKIKRMEEELTELGLKWGYDRTCNRWNDGEFGDYVCITPLNDKLPIYTRDAALFTGSIEQLEVWLHGVRWARDYDRMLRVSDEKRRKKYEAKEVERLALQRKHEEQKKLMKILRSKDAENQDQVPF